MIRASAPKEKSSVECLNCQEKFCDNCFTKVHDQVLSLEHTVISLDRKPVRNTGATENTDAEALGIEEFGIEEFGIEESGIEELSLDDDEARGKY